MSEQYHLADETGTRVPPVPQVNWLERSIRVSAENFGPVEPVLHALSAKGLVPEYESIDADTAFLGFPPGFSIYLSSTIAEVNVLPGSSFRVFSTAAGAMRLMLDSATGLETAQAQVACSSIHAGTELVNCFRDLLPEQFPEQIFPGHAPTAEGIFFTLHGLAGDHENTSIRSLSYTEDDQPFTQIRVDVQHEFGLFTARDRRRITSTTVLRQMCARASEAIAHLLSWSNVRD